MLLLYVKELIGEKMTKLEKLRVIISFIISIVILALSLRVVGIIEGWEMEWRIAREEYQKLQERHEELTTERDELKIKIVENKAARLEAISEKEKMERLADELRVKIEEITSSLEQERKRSSELKKGTEKLTEEKADIKERHKMELGLLETELRTVIARYKLQVLAMTPAQDPTMFTGKVVVVHPPDFLAIGIGDLVAGPLQIELFRRGKMVRELSTKGVSHATLLVRVPPGISLDGIRENDKAEVFLLPEAEDIIAFVENGKVTDAVAPNFLNVDLGTAASLWPDVSIYREGALVGRIVPEKIYLSVTMEVPDVRGIRKGDEIKIIR
ncbi:MAG: hypothetical protein DDT31_00169 [Syntrophomonadaceae bacterium]|nr:hypothetical protein [Bacillota bacterium]